ncbi:hypothetical protein Q457_12390, partial [Escherichia coli ATCC BAA-2196]
VIVLAGQSNAMAYGEGLTVKGFRCRIHTMLRIRALNSWRAAVQ